jgi:hypothetical protein
MPFELANQFILSAWFVGTAKQMPAFADLGSSKPDRISINSHAWGCICTDDARKGQRPVGRSIGTPLVTPLLKIGCNNNRSIG